MEIMWGPPGGRCERSAIFTQLTYDSGTVLSMYVMGHPPLFPGPCLRVSVTGRASSAQLCSCRSYRGARMKKVPCSPVVPNWPTPPPARTRACNGARPRRPRPVRRPNAPEYAPHCPQVSAICASSSTRCCSWVSADRIRPRVHGPVPTPAAPARPHRPHSRPPPEYARIRSPLSAGLSPLRLEKHSVLQLGGARRPH